MSSPTGVITTVGTGAEAQALHRAAAGRDEFATHKLLVIDARAHMPLREPLATQQERMRHRGLRYGVAPSDLEQIDAAVTAAPPSMAAAMLRVVELFVADSAFRLVIADDQSQVGLPPAFVDAVQRGFDREVIADASPDDWLTRPLTRPDPRRVDRALDRDLLAATLDRSDTAIRAWHAWQERASLDDTLGFGELAPVLFENLSRLGVDDADMGRIGGIRRRAWYVYELLKRRVGTAIDGLAAEGIDPMLLGDLPAAMRAAETRSVRAVRTVELCVRPDEAFAAADLLAQHGWASANPVTQRRVDRHTWQRFVSDPGLVLLLHWWPLPQGCSRLVASDTDPTAQLLRLWARTGDPYPGHALRTVCDTADILEWHAGDIDWDRLWSDCARLELVEYGEMYLRTLPTSSPAVHTRAKPRV